MGQEEIVYSFLGQYLPLANLNEQSDLMWRIFLLYIVCTCAVFETNRLAEHNIPIKTV